MTSLPDQLRKFGNTRKQLGGHPDGYKLFFDAADALDNPKPIDFALYVCLNNDTNSLAICAWCAATKAFKNLSDINRGNFDATHWWIKPVKDGELL